MPIRTKIHFSPGLINMSIDAYEKVCTCDKDRLLKRHVNGDWGEVDEDTKEKNNSRWDSKNRDLPKDVTSILRSDSGFLVRINTNFETHETNIIIV